MAGAGEMERLAAEYIQKGNHGRSDYFGLIKELVKRRNNYEKTASEFAFDLRSESYRRQSQSHRADLSDGVRFGD